jgi:ATP-binding cassette, subfamily B, bacterial
MNEMKLSNYSILKRTFRHGRPYWMYIVGIFVLNLMASPISLLKPLALKVLIDSGFGNSPVPSFISYFLPGNFEYSFSAVVWIAIALLLTVALIENLYTVVIWILNTYTGEKLVRTFRHILFNHIQRLSLSYHDRKGTADSVYRVQYDAAAIRSLIIGNLSPIITSVVTVLGVLIILFTINSHFALITCCIIPPMVLLIKISTRKLKKNWTKVKNDESSAMSVIQEVLTSLRVVKAFGQEDGESERFMNKADKAMKGQVKVAWVGALFYFCIGMIYAIGTALFFYFGSHFVQSGAMTLGDLTMVITYLAYIYGPLEKISRNLNELQSSLTSLDRVYALLDEEKEVKEIAHPKHLQHCEGNIEFRNVSFGYKEDAEILQNISFRINPGDRVGIMGTTGAGKSTLINLLTRFYDPTSGEILLDETDIRKFKLSDYRKQFGIVLQEPVLFSTTIGENIAYGFPNADKRQIIEAAKMANAHDFIMGLEEGYDQLVGERGMNLSGGERQRISIARAFIKNAPVLILDEPTSSLDIKTESQIMEAMERLMKGRTTFLITHRLDTLDSCNIILHLDKGRLVEIVNNSVPDALAKKKSSFLATT